jgi:hypothetical protein
MLIASAKCKAVFDAILKCVIVCGGCRAPMAWIHADASSKRLDEKYLVSQRVQMPLPHLAHLLSQVCLAGLP